MTHTYPCTAEFQVYSCYAMSGMAHFLLNRTIYDTLVLSPQELERKMTKMARQLDHLERARREEEMPLLKQVHLGGFRISG